MLRLKEDIYIHSDESDEFIGRLTQSFGLNTVELGLRSGMTFQELIDNIFSKVDRQPADDCTSQIVFYQVRQIMIQELGFDRESINGNAPLKDLFPNRNRKNILGIIGGKLGIRINYFQPPAWFQLASAAVLISSLVLLFFNVSIGLSILIGTLLLVFIAHKAGTSLPMKTLGELVERITRDNLIKLRSDRKSINPKEIRMTVIKLIDDLHALDKLEVHSEQKIIF
jgi:hypothetical protein